MQYFKYTIKNGHIHIDYQVTPNIRFRKSIGEWIDPKKWNAKKNRSKNNSNLNKYLDKIQELCIQIKYDLSLAKKLSTPNYKNEFERRFGLDDSMSFKEWVKEFRDSKEQDSSYFETYDAIINKHFKNLPDSTVKGLGKEYFLGIQNYFKKKTALAASTINTYMNFLLIAANAAFDKFRIKDATQFWHIKRLKSYPVRQIVLSPEELDHIFNTPLEGYEDFARDQFLIGCHTGTRYQVYRKLNETYLHDGILKGSAMKRHHHFNMLTPERLQMLLEGIQEKRNRYEIKHKGSAYDKFQKILPVIGRKAGITRLISRTNRFGEDETFEKCEEIQSHTARRTYCHINFRVNESMSLEDIQKHLGHKSMKTTEKYLFNVL